MAALTVRDLPDQVRDKLRIRAAKNGRSMEAEVRAVLGSAVGAPAPDDSDKSIVDELIAERRAEAARKDREDRRPTRPVLPKREKLEQARSILRQSVPEGTLLVDKFLAGRRRMWGET